MKRARLGLVANYCAFDHSALDTDYEDHCGIGLEDKLFMILVPHHPYNYLWKRPMLTGNIRVKRWSKVSGEFTAEEADIDCGTLTTPQP